MQSVTSQDQIKDLGTILSVWAHPDDETVSAGGILASACLNGQTVVCVTATRGEAGSQDPVRWPINTLGQVREEELKQALKVLGINKHYQLGYPDGGCQVVDKTEAASRIAKFIKTYKPDSILTFGPDGMTGHPDHQAVSGWVDLAVEMTDLEPEIYHTVLTTSQYHDYLLTAHQKLNIFYNIDKPPVIDEAECTICFKCADKMSQRKHKALASMPSQFEKMHQLFDHDYLEQAFRVEAFTLKSK